MGSLQKTRGCARTDNKQLTERSRRGGKKSHKAQPNKLISGPKDLDEQVYVWVGLEGKKIKKKDLNKASIDILVTEVGTHKMSQITFLNNSVNNGFLSLFFFFLRG